METKFMKTGELGFCPTCGTISEVVVLPDDRLQAVICRTVLQKQDISDELAALKQALYQIQVFAATSEDDRCDQDWGELRESLIEIQVWLAVAGEVISEKLNEPVDLMRLAVERLEEANERSRAEG